MNIKILIHQSVRAFLLASYAVIILGILLYVPMYTETPRDIIAYYHFGWFWENDYKNSSAGNYRIDHLAVLTRIVGVTFIFLAFDRIIKVIKSLT